MAQGVQHALTAEPVDAAAGVAPGVAHPPALVAVPVRIRQGRSSGRLFFARRARAWSRLTRWIETPKRAALARDETGQALFAEAAFEAVQGVPREAVVPGTMENVIRALVTLPKKWDEWKGRVEVPEEVPEKVGYSGGFLFSK